MNKLLKNPEYKANIGYNGFDMSQRVKFTSTVGELLPVYYDLLQPGDKISLSTELRTRTLPLESPVMCSLNEKIDWFFVPVEQIYKLFGSFYFQVDDIHSSMYDMSTVQNSFPQINKTGLKTIADAMSQPTDVDQYFTANYHSGYRLAEMLGIPLLAISHLDTASNSISPLFPCAYQKIYFDYYRLTDRELNDPSCYSLDRFYNEGLVDPAIGQKMFVLRYHPWKKDFYTNIFVSPLFSPQSLGGFDYSSRSDDLPSEMFHNWVTEGTDDISFADSNASNVGAVVNPSQIVNDTQSSASTSAAIRASLDHVAQQLSPSAIRSTFAVQKFFEVARRSAKRVDAQQLAHFGVKMPKGVEGTVTYLGGSQSVIHIGDVISTADTATTDSGSSLGAQAGKGYGYGNGSTIKYVAPCHGVLMAIYSCVPELDYGFTYLDRIHFLTDRENWPTPEFDNLGMQPLFQYEVATSADSSEAATVIGWQYRYSEFKIKPDRIFGGLKHGQNLAIWTTQKYTFGNWLSSFLVDPFFLNDVMTVGYAPTTSNPFNSDPLIHELYCDVKKASKMSIYGLESL